MNCPHFNRIPTEPAAHAAFRLDLYRRAARSRSLRAMLKRWCAEDLLFHVNVFGWTLATLLHPECPTWPALLWKCQNQALYEMSEAIDRQQDVRFKKSRDMGASWLMLYALEWRARFRNRAHVGLMSRNEDCADGKDMGALLPKLDFLHQEQTRCCPWLTELDRIDRSAMFMGFKDSQGSISVEPNTENAFRGNRKVAVGIDEYQAFSLHHGYAVDAATLHATDCRIFNYTARGDQGAAWELDRKDGVRTITLWWWQNPYKLKGEYVSDGNAPAPDYKGKRRSEWYDGKCAKALNPNDILAELDGEWVGTSDAFFPTDLVDSYQEKFCIAPYATAGFFHDENGQPEQMVLTAGGDWRLWFHPICENGRLRAHWDHDYAIGVDVAAGTGRSDSVIVVGDKTTGEKVAEYVDNRILPHALACKAAAAARFFRAPSGEPALVIWESNGGPGTNFRDGLMSAPVGFSHVYYQRDPQGGGYKTTDKVGYPASTKSQRRAIENYKTALIREQFIDRSFASLQECRLYVLDGDAVVHPAARRKAVDPSGSGVNHGDRVRATALLWHVMGGPARRPVPERKPKIPMDSLWGRRQHFANLRREAAYGGW